MPDSWARVSVLKSDEADAKVQPANQSVSQGSDEVDLDAATV